MLPNSVSLNVKWHFCLFSTSELNDDKWYLYLCISLGFCFGVALIFWKLWTTKHVTVILLWTMMLAVVMHVFHSASYLLRFWGCGMMNFFRLRQWNCAMMVSSFILPWFLLFSLVLWWLCHCILAIRFCMCYFVFINCYILCALCWP